MVAQCRGELLNLSGISVVKKKHYINCYYIEKKLMSSNIELPDCQMYYLIGTVYGFNPGAGGIQVNY